MSEEPTKGRPPDPEEEIFEACLVRPIEERARYLEEVCAGDAALRQRVEELLRSHSLAEFFLEEPPVSVGVGQTIQLDVPLAEKVGDHIGRYKLLQQIGQGGCGLVYMAEQEEPVKRRVALKVIKLGMDTKSVIARFEAERQALAMMDHPNIAKVLDVGATNSGRPYFVMELVRGIKITDYCDENKLSTKERLDLFIKVCQAIQHAHQKGVIHRDIKPSNILVTMNDGVPAPKVIDFGIAKATHGKLTDKTLFTAFEQFIGTPAYMSPEQAEMSARDIDTRSDIYSLGVLLYELLTGQTPFDATKLLQAGLDEIRRTIREQEPSRPSTRLSTMQAADLTSIAAHRQAQPPKLIHLVSGDLDWIVMKALEKDRARRYETANGFAADIQRHLNTEPVTACPPGNLYKFQKLVRRNKLVFAAAGAVIAALIIGLGVATWMFVKEQQARQQSEIERKIANSEAIKSRQVAQFLEDMLKGVRPSAAMGRDTTMLKEILGQTAKRVDKDLTNEPAAEVELLTTIGEVYHDMGQYPQAEEVERETLVLSRKLSGSESLVVAGELDNLAATLGEENKPVEGEATVREALEIQRKLLQTDDIAVARSLDILGCMLGGQNKAAEAGTAFRNSLAMRRKLLGNENRDVAFSLMGVASIDWQQGKVAEAEAEYREVLAIQKKVYGAEHPDMEVPLDNLANLLIDEGKLSEAETVVREVLALQQKILGVNHPHLIRSLWIMTDVLRKQGKLADGEAFARELVSLQSDRFGNEDSALTRLGEFVAQEGRLAEAESLFRRAIAIDRKPPDNKERPNTLAWALGELGKVLNQQGNASEAEASFREDLEIKRVHWTNDPAQWEDPVSLLTGLLARQGKFAAAEQVFNDVLTPAVESQTNSAGLLLLRGQLRARYEPAGVSNLPAVSIVPQSNPQTTTPK